MSDFKQTTEQSSRYTEWLAQGRERNEQRLREIADEAAAVITRAKDGDRDLSAAEVEQLEHRKDELSVLKAVLETLDTEADRDQQAQVLQRSRELQTAMDQARGPVDPLTGRPVELRALFAEAETRALRGEGFRFGLGQCAEILERSTTTALAGATTSVGAGGDTSGIWLPRESGGLNLMLRPGARLESGIWPANAATSATSEGGTKPTLDPASLGTDVVQPYAVTSNVTIQSEASGRGVEQFTWAGTRKVRRSVNDAFTTAMVAAGGAARAFDTDVVTSVDGAISEMMATAATVPSLVIVDPAHFSALATAGGDDATDAFPAFRGVRLVSSAVAGLADHALIVDGTATSHSMSGVEVRTQPQVISNSTDCVVEVWFAVVAYGASGVTFQDLTAA